MNSKFATVPERPNFPQEEERVLKYWTEIDAFKKQLELSKGKPAFTFYDGPPFATGLPHYGHIAAGTIKDVVTRYATMNGQHVERRFGWDCHGLPIEFEIDKIHKIANSVEREAIGVAKYNELCREIVMRYASQWETIIGRFGRWIDFKNDYKTMDCKYMESVWWAFEQMYKKGLVYRGSKIMPFSTACNTVLSNFEAGSNYKDVSDPAIIVTFPTLKDPKVNFIAWTTTPWTLPANLALAVHPTLEYVKFQDQATDKIYICMKARLDWILKQCKIAKHVVLETMTGESLAGIEYEPLYNYFDDMRSTKCFSVITATYVTTDAGTGIVHQAPGFGEEDYNACIKHGLIEPGKAPVPIDQDGKFIAQIKDYQGQYIKDADKVIMADLKAAGRLLNAGTVNHSYPFCWRSQTPLIYRAFDCWFIRVTDIKTQLLEENTKTNWVPSFVQERRFHNWLVDAKDWCFSRNRYWGNPIPIWISDDGEEVVCVGSIAELERLSGVTGINDLHREYIDNITIPSQQGKGVLRRIPEVFDCWFESGAMPFAQSHYPFSVQDEQFMKGFPANFIAEGLDQTRGWFYTLMVISTAIKGCAPFQNLIVNGIVLAENGTKMSKSKKNYPDPTTEIADVFGADACRLYLCNSPVVRAEPLKFAKEGVKTVVRDIFLPWFNAYRFLIQNITRWEVRAGKRFVFDPTLKYKLIQDPNSNYTDNWIIAANQNLIKHVRHEMDSYKLYNVVRPTLSFLEDLTNWYVRLNRPRMKGDDNDADDQFNSLNTLFDVLLNATQLMSPITPFLSEHIFLNMRNGLAEDSPINVDSIHFTQMPTFDPNLINESIEETVKRMQNAIETGRLVRDKANISMKYPLARVVLVDADTEILKGYQTLQKYIMEELNCLQIELKSNEDDYVVYKAEGENRAMGQAFGKKFDKNAKAAIEKLSSDQIRTYLKSGQVDVIGLPVVTGMLKVSKEFKEEFQTSKQWAVASSMKSSIMLDVVQNEELKQIGLAREVTNRIQRLRKTSGISIDDQIEIYYTCEDHSKEIASTLAKFSDKVIAQTRMPFLDIKHQQGKQVFIGETEFINPDDEKDVVKLKIYLAAAKFTDKLTEDYAQHGDTFVSDLKNFILQHDRKVLRNLVSANQGDVAVVLNGVKVLLKHKVHFYLDARDMLAL